jgi:glycosyltransferase involved in cell wall biosynthesis
LVYEETCNYHVSSSSSFLEAFGLNIAEALALGKPVLATRSGGGEMQIEDGVNGWLVPTNDVSALAEKISYIVNHTEILPLLSDNCQAIAIQDHCKQLFEIYQSCQNSR